MNIIPTEILHDQIQWDGAVGTAGAVLHSKTQEDKL